jgi:hypothetical protein
MARSPENTIKPQTLILSSLDIRLAEKPCIALAGNVCRETPTPGWHRQRIFCRRQRPAELSPDGSQRLERVSNEFDVAVLIPQTVSMSFVGKLGRVVGVLAMAAAVGLLIGWMASRSGDIAPIVVPPSANAPITALPLAPPAAAPDSNIALAATPRQRPVEQVPAPTPQYSTDWEQKLDDILLAEDDANSKADKILALIPTAPPDAQVELSQHLVNMVQDDHYAGAAQLLTNAATSSAVSTVLMNDLLNRGNTLKLPMLLDVAQNNDHPLKDQAREMLELLLQEDDGTNWDQWSTSINTWLQNNSQ